MLKLERARVRRGGLDGLNVFGPANLDLRQDADRVVLHTLEHRAEHLERFALVLLLRVALRIAAQMNTLAQIIERADVLLPMRVELAQHDLLLDLVHDVRADLGGFAIVGLR